MAKLDSIEENNSQIKTEYKVLIVIPAFNTNHYIDKLLLQIREFSNIKILIIDDGSNIPIQPKANFDGIKIITHNKNSGKGKALMSGIHWANDHGFSHIISIDSDLQHPPKYIQKFLDEDPQIDLIIGARNFGGDMPFHRRLSNLITSLLISVRTGKKVKDSQSGFRQYKISSVLKNKYSENGFQFESEVLIKLVLNGAKIDHLNIPSVYGKEDTSINNIKDTYKFIRLYFKSFFWSYA